MKRAVLTVLIVTFFVASRLFAGGGNEPTTAAASPELLAGYRNATAAGVLVQWKVEGDTLWVSLSAATTGWVAVGFDPTRQMRDANIIIGYVSGGEVHLRDDYGTSGTRHDPDTSIGGMSNLSNVDGTEANGMTTIAFSIPLNSGDSADRPLVAGKNYHVIVAHGPNGSDDFGSYHAERGSFDITI